MSALLAQAAASVKAQAKTAAAAAAAGAAAAATTAALSKGLGADTTRELTPVIAATGGITSFLGSISYGASQVGLFFNQYGMVMFQILLVLLCLAGLVYYFFFRPPTITPVEQKGKVEDVGNILNSATTKTKEGFQSGSGGASSSTAPEQYNMVNIQPLAIKQVAYMGPVTDGTFDAQTGTTQALRAGFRSFVFQIDYLNKEPDTPVLVYRNDNITLISKNTGDIGKVVEVIANTAFRPESPKYTEPIIIYLHFLRAPKDDPTADTSEYILFLSKVAKALAPLAPQHLNMTPLGAFRRQMQESTLLTTPFNNFNHGQVIILSNADTTRFRNHEPAINPAEDLDYWVNMRVYMNTDVDDVGTLGATVAPPKGVSPSAIVVSLPNLLKLSEKQLDAFIAEAKQQFVIALPSQKNNPSADEMNTSLNKLGLNMIPLDIFSHDIKEVKALVELYNNKTYRPKPLGLRIATS
jgi:hypothetical protein